MSLGVLSQRERAMVTAIANFFLKFSTWDVGCF